MTLSAVCGRSPTRLLFLVAAALVAWTLPASAAVVWKADFETASLSQFNGSVNATKGTRKNIEFVADPVQEGKTAGKFTIHDDDTFGSTQMRVQVIRRSTRTGEGGDVYLSFYFLVAADPMIRANIAYWETDTSNHNMMNWWLEAKAGGGTTLQFGTGNLGNTKHLFTGDVAVGKWHQVAFHIHWSTDATLGNIVFWLDGTQVVDEKTATKPDGNSLFFEAGIHRASRSTLIDTVFFDSFVEVDSMADLVLGPPVPGGGNDAGAPDAGTGGADAASDSGPASGSGGASGGGSGGSNGSGGNGSGGSAVAGSGGAAMPPGQVTSGGCALAAGQVGSSPLFGGGAMLLLALLARRRRGR